MKGANTHIGINDVVAFKNGTVEHLVIARNGSALRLLSLDKLNTQNKMESSLIKIRKMNSEEASKYRKGNYIKNKKAWHLRQLALIQGGVL